MANPWAGEVTVTVDGVAHVAKLTLGALAELEEALAEDSLMALVARFEGQAFRARDVLMLLAAGLRAGGWEGDAGTLARAEIAGGPVAAARSAAALLALAFAGPAADG
ncbi:GTA-gp10 family protein [Frigidibacter sp. MR17.24]|uniref:GTA-gp10 family protein n=1 Tax=Frigidibacter sp. MR17.24 TaxID=3127345 RepID=UPI003012C33B